MELDNAITESWNIIGELKSLLLGPDANGTFWQPCGGQLFGNNNALNYYFQTVYFNKLQRWQARFLYKTNGFAISAIDNLVSMVLGAGFQYSMPNESEQARLDEWMRETKWKQRHREAATKLFVDGEVFFRKFGDQIRFVDPEHVYDMNGVGVITDPTDYETVLSYTVDGTSVPADEMQHRKLGWTEERRGTSVLFSIANTLVNAESLLASLVRTAEQLSKFAAIRQHAAPKASVEEFKSDVRTTQTSSVNALHPRGSNVESYAPGTILDISDKTEYIFPNQYIDGDKYVTVLRAVLRLAAARVGLPENVLSQDQDSIAAYNGQLVADSHISKGLRAWQDKLSEWDKQLLAMYGFDEVNIELPEVAIHDRNELVATGNFLLANKLASKATVATMFGQDYEAEVEQMETEPVPEMPGAETPELNSPEVENDPPAVDTERGDNEVDGN